MDIFGNECARARESVSADLDRELNELDQRRLHAHLRVCADCSVWAERVQATTVQLREAPFEAPPAVAFDVPRRGRMWRVRPALVVAPAAAASLFALLAGQSFLFGRHPVTASASPRSSQPIATAGVKVFAHAELSGVDSISADVAEFTSQGRFRAT